MQQRPAEQERLAAGIKLETETAKLISSGSSNEAAARLYGELLESNSARLRTIATLESQMEGLTTENLAQQPSLPERAIKPKKSLVALAATLGAGFVALLFVFARHALRGVHKDPERAEKILRLRRALGLQMTYPPLLRSSTSIPMLLPKRLRLSEMAVANKRHGGTQG